MKTCPTCRAAYADVQDVCPSCGRKPGDPIGELVGGYDRSLEEGFGRARRMQFTAVIAGLLLLLVLTALAWFLGS